MKNVNVFCLLLTGISLMLFVWIFGNWDSERTKRVELEAELAACIYSKKTFYRRPTTEERIYQDTATINDTVLGLSKWIMKAQKSGYVFPAKTPIYDPTIDTTIIYDSSEVTE